MLWAAFDHCDTGIGCFSELIIVPSGFDAGAYDPLGRMQMHSDGYRSLTGKLLAAADRHCGGRLLMTHEGGYNSWTVLSSLAVMEALGHSTGTEDLFAPACRSGGQDLQPHQQAAIDAAKAALAGLVFGRGALFFQLIELPSINPSISRLVVAQHQGKTENMFSPNPVSASRGMATKGWIRLVH